MMTKRKLCIVVTVPLSFGLYKGQLKFLSANGYDITCVASDGPGHQEFRNDGIKTKVINMKRKPSAFHDLASLVRLTWFFMFNRFDIVCVSTPKASLLASMACLLAFHKNVVYSIWGRAYENTTGLTRKFYDNIEKFVCWKATEVFSLSQEMMDDFIVRKLCPPQKIRVIGAGSLNGIDLNKFSLNQTTHDEGLKIRETHNISPNDITILFVGRIRKDKGINELVYAFRNLLTSFGNIHLILLGRMEEFDPLEEEVTMEIKTNKKIHLEGYSNSVESYLAAANIFAFPSYREGFPNAPLEASAMKLPVVAFNVIGCREAVKDGYSGILCNEISSKSLEAALKSLIVNPALREQMGDNGHKRVVKEFDQMRIWNELLRIYNDLTEQKVAT